MKSIKNLNFKIGAFSMLFFSAFSVNATSLEPQSACSNSSDGAPTLSVHHTAYLDYGTATNPHPQSYTSLGLRNSSSSLKSWIDNSSLIFNGQGNTPEESFSLEIKSQFPFEGKKIDGNGNKEVIINLPTEKYSARSWHQAAASKAIYDAKFQVDTNSGPFTVDSSNCEYRIGEFKVHYLEVDKNVNDISSAYITFDSSCSIKVDQPGTRLEVIRLKSRGILNYNFCPNKILRALSSFSRDDIGAVIAQGGTHNLGESQCAMAPCPGGTKADLETCMCVPVGIIQPELEPEPQLEKICIDSDGDGWGWDGEASCKMTRNDSSPEPSAGECIDSDGDGWGWNGVSSCKMENSN